jgi:hypothetical protein
MSIETLSAEIRRLRARIEAQRANPHSWPTKEEELAADVDRYDRRLLKAAAMLRLETSAIRHREQFLLSDDDRTALEARLQDAGLELHAQETPRT